MYQVAGIATHAHTVIESSTFDGYSFSMRNACFNARRTCSFEAYPTTSHATHRCHAKQTRATKIVCGWLPFLPSIRFYWARARARAHTHSRVIAYRTAERNSRDTPPSLARARMETLCSRTSHRLISALLDRARLLRLRSYRRMAT